MANLCALINEEFGFHWIGFYLVDKSKNELYLGPFQGPLACTQIQFGKGVCGTSWQKKTVLNVSNVHEFDGHIACSSLTESEIVIPILNNDGEVIAVLDIDSSDINYFNEIDEKYLKEISKLI